MSEPDEALTRYKAAVDDLVGALLQPDWHDPACPFKDHCHCGSDDEPPPHDRVLSDLQVRAANRIKALEGFLRHLRQWDQMNPPMTGDHAAHAASIDALLKEADQ